MEPAAEGVARLVLALLELHQRTAALLADHRQLQADRAALRQGAGSLVASEGRLSPLGSGLGPSNDLRSPPRQGLPPLTSRPRI